MTYTAASGMTRWLARVMVVCVLLGAGVLCASAQSPKIPRVGVLRPGSPPPADFGQREAFERGLRELGWTPGTSILIDYRYAEGKPERLSELAVELARVPVDVIVASATVGVRAAQQASRTIPIVMSTLPDPVGQGFVTSLAHPGGNTTGLTLDAEELAGKQIELLKEAVPALSRVAVLRNVDEPYEVARKQIESAARALKIEVKEFRLSHANDLGPTFAAMSQARVGAVLVRRDTLIVERNQPTVLALAAQHRLPAIYSFREFPEAGGFMSYGTNVFEIHRRSATFVDKILKGAKPGDMPIERPAKFELVMNVKTARALGVALPQALLLQADHVIQ